MVRTAQATGLSATAELPASITTSPAAKIGHSPLSTCRELLRVSIPVLPPLDLPLTPHSGRSKRPRVRGPSILFTTSTSGHSPPHCCPAHPAVRTPAESGQLPARPPASQAVR